MNEWGRKEQSWSLTNAFYPLTALAVLIEAGFSLSNTPRLRGWHQSLWKSRSHLGCGWVPVGRAPPSHPPQPLCSDRGASPSPHAGWQNLQATLSCGPSCRVITTRPLQDQLSAGPGPQNLFFPGKFSSAVLLPWKQELQSRHLPPHYAHYPRHLTCPIFSLPPTPLPLLHPAPFSPGPQQTPRFVQASVSWPRPEVSQPFLSRGR